MNLDQFTRWVTILQPTTEKAVIRGLKAGGLRLSAEVTRQIGIEGLVDTGTLRNSVTYTPVADGCLVSVNAPHAVALEHGSRPFSAPLAPLVAWVLRKGIADSEKAATQIAWGIIKKFKREGSRPRNYFRNAFTAALPHIQGEIDRECAKIGWQPHLSAKKILF